MDRLFLNTLGINTAVDIPVTELLSPSFSFDSHSLGEKTKDIIVALRKVIYEFNSTSLPELSHIHSAKDVSSIMKNTFKACDTEECWAIYIGTNNQVLYKELVNKGNINSVQIGACNIIRSALDVHAAAVIIAHNHPSGNPDPSSADIKQTESLRDKLKVFEIALMDHVIFGNKTFFSFANEKSYKY